MNFSCLPVFLSPPTISSGVLAQIQSAIFLTRMVIPALLAAAATLSGLVPLSVLEMPTTLICFQISGSFRLCQTQFSKNPLGSTFQWSGSHRSGPPALPADLLTTVWTSPCEIVTSFSGTCSLMLRSSVSLSNSLHFGNFHTRFHMFQACHRTS